MGGVRLVMFDMDGLLIDSERLYVDMTEARYTEHGLRLRRDVMISYVGTPNPFDYNALIDDPTPERVETARRIMQGIMADGVEDMCTRGVPLKPGARELLEYLNSAGIPAMVASLTKRSFVERLLKAAGIYSCFSSLICGAEVTRKKPDPEIYLLGCARAGVAPQEALVLEDSENGARAARNGGIPYIVIPDLRMPAEDVRKDALAILPTLRDVETLLKEESEI